MDNVIEILERHVTFETANLLRNHGFNSTCRSFYKTRDGKTIRLHANSSHRFDYCNNASLQACNDEDETNIAAPTQQMAHEWILLNMGLLVCVDCPIVEDGKLKYKFYIIDTNINKVVYNDEKYYDEYHKAREAGMLYVLKNV